MGRWTAASCALALAVLPGCRGADTAASVAPPPAETAMTLHGSPSTAATTTATTTVTTTSSVTTVPSAERAILDRLPPFVEPRECTSPLGELFEYEYAFVAGRVEVGARSVRQTDDDTWVVERRVRLTGNEALRVPSVPSLLRDLELDVWEGMFTGDEFLSSTVDFERLAGATDVLILSSLGPHDGGVEDLGVHTAIFVDDGRLDAGSCTDLINDIGGRLAAAAETDLWTFVVAWAGAASGERDALAAEAWAIEWSRLDPLARDLQAGGMPGVVRASRDVRGAYVDLQVDPGVPYSVVFASDGGIGLGVGTGSEPTVLPLYYIPATSREIRVLLVEPSGRDALDELRAARVLGVVDVGELHAGGGIRVAGTVADPIVTVMSREQVMAAMGRELADFEPLRLQYLAN